MRKEPKEYIIDEVGNYQICLKHNKDSKEHFLISPLNLMQEDSIIKSAKSSYLVLRHATLDSSFISQVFKMDGKDFLVDINAIHRMLRPNISYGNSEVDKIGSNKHYGKSMFLNAELTYMRLENECASAGSYKLVFKLNEKDIDMFYNIEKVDKY